MIPRTEVISYTLHQGLRWRFNPSPRHFEQWLTPLAFEDLRSVAHISPIGFVTSELGLSPVALSHPNLNRIGDPQDRWRGQRLPIQTALYPFSLIEHAGHNKLLLSVARDTEVIGVGYEEPMFGPDGQPAPRVQAIMRKLEVIDAGKRQMAKDAQSIESLGCLYELPKISTGLGRRSIRVIRRDKLHVVSANSGVNSSVCHLAFAAAFSLRQSSDNLLQSLPVASEHETIIDPKLRESATDQVKSMPSQLIIEQDTLSFNFSGRGGLFRSG